MITTGFVPTVVPFNRNVLSPADMLREVSLKGFKMRVVFSTPAITSYLRWSTGRPSPSTHTIVRSVPCTRWVPNPSSFTRAATASISF